MGIKNVKYLIDFMKRLANFFLIDQITSLQHVHNEIPGLIPKLFREYWIFGIGMFGIQDYWNFRDWDFRDSGFPNFRILRDSRFFGIPNPSLIQCQYFGQFYIQFWITVFPRIVSADSDFRDSRKFRDSGFPNFRIFRDTRFFGIPILGMMEGLKIWGGK